MRTSVRWIVPELEPRFLKMQGLPGRVEPRGGRRPLVRMQTCGWLQEAGVVAPASMPDAMVAMAGVGPIQVLVTVFRMPLDGLVGEVKRLYPAVRVLFMA